jgi:hypothetical protein
MAKGVISGHSRLIVSEALHVVRDMGGVDGGGRGRKALSKRCGLFVQS